MLYWAVMRRPLLQCPCCDFFTLSERGGFEICPICYWEDEGSDLEALDQPSGANHITLREARRNFNELGACDHSARSLVLELSERARFRREVRATVY